MKKLISNSTYELLKLSGHAVPRTENNYIQTNFSVGKEYTVTSKLYLEPIKVCCTQNCPHHLKIIE